MYAEGNLLADISHCFHLCWETTKHENQQHVKRHDMYGAQLFLVGLLMHLGDRWLLAWTTSQCFMFLFH